jgi:hypothetical protein
MTLNETSGKQGIQSYINFNDIWKRKCIDIFVTLNETPGKQGNQESNHILLIWNEI